MSASARPRVSVLVPSYNHARFLRRRLDSIQAQTYRDFEVLILDDASDDASDRVIRTYLPRPGWRYLRNPSNSGSAFKQWERGLAEARGEHVWIAESDDWAASNLLARLVAALEAHPGAGVACCQSWCVDAADRVLGSAAGWTADLDPGRWRADFVNDGRDEIRRFLSRKNTIPSASAAVFRRALREASGPLRTDFRLCGDWLHWIQLLARADLAFVAEPLNYWRQNTSHARVACPGTLEWLEGERVLREAARLLNLDEAQTNELLLYFLRRCWQWQREYAEGLDASRRQAPPRVRETWWRRLARAWRSRRAAGPDGGPGGDRT